MSDHQRKGGIARSRKLSPEDRKAIASAGAQARWAKARPERDTLPKAVCGSTDRPLRIGGLSIPCYVLEDERRVLTVAGMQEALRMAKGGSMVGGLNRLELFIRGQRIGPFVPEEVAERVRSPIVFVTPTRSRGSTRSSTSRQRSPTTRRRSSSWIGCCASSSG